jgi:hypothetical protein
LVPGALQTDRSVCCFTKQHSEDSLIVGEGLGKSIVSAFRAYRGRNTEEGLATGQLRSAEQSAREVYRRKLTLTLRGFVVIPPTEHLLIRQAGQRMRAGGKPA